MRSGDAGPGMTAPVRETRFRSSVVLEVAVAALDVVPVSAPYRKRQGITTEKSWSSSVTPPGP